MWKLYAKRERGTNVKTCNDSMKMCFKHKIRMKVDHKIKDITIV
jgi:hypothetical protein